MVIAFVSEQPRLFPADSGKCNLASCCVFYSDFGDADVELYWHGL